MQDCMEVKDKMSFQVGKGCIGGLFLSGVMELKLFDEFGQLKEHRKKSNTVTVLGHQMAADQILASPAVAVPGWIEVGTGTGQDANDATLAIHIAGSRTALDSKTRGANAIITMVCTMGAGVGTGAITEAGVFNVVTENTTDLILYDDFDVVNKGADDTLVITWTFTFA